MTKAKRGQSSERSVSGMTLDVRNFGPIAKGQVELRPLTVFAGPSNTGKSWLATLIYLMERILGEGSMFLRVHNIFAKQYLENRLFEHESKEESLVFPEDIDRWCNELLARGEIRLTATEVEMIRESVESVKGDVGGLFKRYYGVDKISDLISKDHQGKTHLSISLGRMAYHLGITPRVDKISLLGVDMPETITLYPKQVDVSYISELLEELNEIKRVQNREQPRDVPGYAPFEKIVDMIMTSFFLRESDGVTYYLPADRGGVMRTHSLMIGEIIRDVSREKGPHRSFLPVMPGVVGDFLYELHRIAKISSWRKSGRPVQGSLDDLVKILEKEILRGKVEVKIGAVDYPNFLYRPQGWSRLLSLTGVSSMVSEITSVALYLEYLVKPGNLLIIEEPEAHLHPALQAHFTKVIACIVKAGVRVLITTHSEWVLEELANIVARGEVEKSRVKNKYKFSEVGLQEKDVGVWLFDYVNKNNMKKGSKIEKVSWDLDEGGYITGYDEVAMALHNDWADLVSRSS